ncbi:MAG: hypothetical protein JNK58_06165 [Phycisphaerae bacterium]|nr:hypothetical protein [Phycisphaerae bacterium]
MKPPPINTAHLAAAIRPPHHTPPLPRTARAAEDEPAQQSSDATRIRTPGAAAGLNLAFKNGLEAVRALDALDSLDAKLDELTALVARSADADPATFASIRAKIDAAVASINDSADAATARLRTDHPATLDYARARSESSQLPRSPYSFTNVSESVEQFRAALALEPGESLDLNVEITASAQHAGFYLSFGNDSIDLSAATATFVIEIAGNSGAKTLSFASGTTIASIRDAINAFTDQTGVTAGLSGTGIALKSTGLGDDRFVSVRVIDAAGAFTPQPAAGIYELHPENNHSADPARYTPLSAASNPIQDFGQSVRGLVNGVAFRGNATTIRAFENADATDPYAQLRLSLEAAQRLVPFRALTITRDASSEVNRPPILDPDALQQPGNASTTEISAARRRLDSIRDTLRRTRDAHRAEAGTLTPATDAAPIDPARIRDLLIAQPRTR